MPQGASAISSSPAGSNFTNVVGANAGVVVKPSSGVLRGFTVNTAGTQLVLYDGTSTSGTKIGTFATTAAGPWPSLNIAFKTGLFAVTTGTSDITIQWF